MNEGGMSEYNSDAMDKTIPIDDRRIRRKKQSWGEDSNFLTRCRSTSHRFTSWLSQDCYTFLSQYNILFVKIHISRIISQTTDKDYFTLIRFFLPLIITNMKATFVLMCVHYEFIQVFIAIHRHV